MGQYILTSYHIHVQFNLRNLMSLKNYINEFQNIQFVILRITNNYKKFFTFYPYNFFKKRK